jgi:VanZ family protein
MNHYFSKSSHYLASHAWPTYLWSALMIGLCLTPARQIPEGTQIPGLDKIAHIGLFSIWAFLLTSYKQGKFLFILVTGMSLGLGIELLQKFTALGRSFEWLDLAADTVGVVLGFLTCTFWRPAKEAN